MGNYISHRDSHIKGKVIFSNGTVHEFDQSLTVAELMLEHPRHFVVELCSLMNGNKPTPLPADKKLEQKKAYLMLPMKKGKTAVMSANEAHQIILKAKCITRSDPLLSTARILPPLFIRMCQADTRVRHKVILKERDGSGEKLEKNDNMELLTEILDERPEFLSRQFSGKGWKPSLDTIKEKGVEKKVPHWLF